MWKEWIAGVLVALACLFVVIQVVPYGRAHGNPPVTAEPPWSSPDVRAIALRACYDCHSNETCWPWYSHVAPVSWLVQRDVIEGRQVLNFSEWNRPQPEAAESARTVIEGEMPPSFYVLLHPDVNLPAAERDRLVEGLIATFGRGGEHEGEEGDKD